MKKYKVTLTKDEREYLEDMVHKGSNKAQKIRNAYILLNCDEGDYSTKVNNVTTSKVLQISPRMIDRVKKLFVEESLEYALNGKPHEINTPPKIDGDLESKLVLLACSETPEGYARWSLRLLAEKMVELNYIESISHETIRQVLKKTNLSHGKKNDS